MTNLNYIKVNKQDSAKGYSQTELANALSNGDIYDIPNVTSNFLSCSVKGTEYYARVADLANAEQASSATDTINTASHYENFASRNGQWVGVKALGWLDLSKYTKGSTIAIKGKINVTMHDQGGGRCSAPHDGPSTRLVVLAGDSNYNNYAHGWEIEESYHGTGSDGGHWVYWRRGDCGDYWGLFDDIVAGACSQRGQAYSSDWQKHYENPNLKKVNMPIVCYNGDRGTHTINIDVKFTKKEEKYLTIMAGFHAWKDFGGENAGRLVTSIAPGKVTTGYALSEKTDMHCIKNGKEYIYIKS